MPLISVVVPVYKVENYLNRCVESVLKQTFTDFELILVDDGSPDRCGEICDEYAKLDQRVHVIHKKNGGLSDARNAGIDWIFKYSNSDWITFIDSDDWVHERYLEALYTGALSERCAVSIATYVDTETELPKINANNLKGQVWDVQQYYVQHQVNATVAWGKLYRKDCFETIRYPAGKIHEDEYITYRILFSQKNVVVIEEPLYAYFFNPEGISKMQWSPKKLDAMKALEERIIFFEKKNNSEMKQFAIEEYMLYLAKQIENINLRNKGEYKKIKSMLNRKLRWALIKYWKIVKKHLYDKKRIVSVAFPKGMKMYTIFKGKIRKDY